MALIKCPECSKEVSNSAEKCPHCGFRKLRRSLLLPLLGCLAIVIFSTSMCEKDKASAGLTTSQFMAVASSETTKVETLAPGAPSYSRDARQLWSPNFKKTKHCQVSFDQNDNFTIGKCVAANSISLFCSTKENFLEIDRALKNVINNLNRCTRWTGPKKHTIADTSLEMASPLKSITEASQRLRIGNEILQNESTTAPSLSYICVTEKEENKIFSFVTKVNECAEWTQD